METLNRHFFADTAVMLGRSMKHILRSFDTVITVCITPVAIMLMFVYVFGGAMGGGMSTREYVNYSLPGILLISISNGIAYTALRLFTDIKGGFFDRFSSMPVSPSAALWGHVLTSLVSNALSLAVIFLAALLMGFRSSAGILNWLAVIGILMLFTLALTWVAVIAGLNARSAEGSSAFSYPLVYLPFFSSAFLPVETMPAAIRLFAENQPVTAIVDSLRALLMNKAVGNDIWIALIWCIVILIVAWFFAMRSFRRRSA